MKFNSQVCTTIEQSERLVSLGLKKETADMSISIHSLDTDNGIKYSLIPYAKCKFRIMYNIIPSWSLHRLIEMAQLPQSWQCLSGDWYNEVIAHIQSMIHINQFNKEYLEKL